MPHSEAQCTVLLLLFLLLGDYWFFVACRNTAIVAFPIFGLDKCSDCSHSCRMCHSNALVVNVFQQHANTDLRKQEHTTKTRVGIGKDSGCILTSRASPSVTATVSIQCWTVGPSLYAVEMVDMITVWTIPDCRLSLHDVVTYHTFVCSCGQLLYQQTYETNV